VPAETEQPAVESQAQERPATSRATRVLLLWVLPLIVAAIGVYWYGSGGRYVATDNAYVRQDRVDVTPQLSGNVQEVRVAENAHVEPGQVVLVLDDTLLKVAVQRAEASLANARLGVSALQAGYREKLGEVAMARRTSQYAVREYERQREMADHKLLPLSALDTAHHAADTATGSIEVLELQLEQAEARLGGDPGRPVDEHPDVRAALAERDKALVDLGHTVIAAPRAGIASHLPKVGDRVEEGRAAFAIVTDGTIWVEANFEETDLEWARPGETAQVEIDTYPGRKWSGRVESIAQATGAEFSLLPAQNASGNWVKVVQRVPVRIAIAVAPGDPPLRSGMSATVEIDTGAHRRFDRWFRALH